MRPHWLPNLFIAGVPKAGTSSLHEWLSAHPDAFGAIDKETCFFADPDSHIHRRGFNITDGLKLYRRQFPIPAGQNPRVVIDSTPAYIYHQAALDHIPDLPGAPRCVFLLREPSSQILSQFNYFQNNWSWIPADLSFAAYLDILRQGQGDFGGNELAREALRNADYLPFLQRWRKRLGPQRMLVCTFDDLKSDPKGLTRRVASWAGLDPAFYDDFDFSARNETYHPRWRGLQRINIALRAYLPKGRLYDAARGLYRRLNTSKPAADQDRAALLASLGQGYAAQNARLAQEFGLDLSGWPLPVAPDQAVPSSMSP